MAARLKAAASPALIRGRPLPPEGLDPDGEFRPDPALADWARRTFIERDGPLVNDEFAHLRVLTIGFLWTNVPNRRHQRGIVGQCELGEPRAMQGKWSKAQQQQQRRQWFGLIPDYMVTLDADYVLAHGDIEFCHLVEHELLHAGYELDDCGGVKFRKSTGLPIPAIRGHDVEEHLSIVKRYGAVTPQLREMFDALKAGPSVAPIRVSHACGTCRLKAV